MLLSSKYKLLFIGCLGLLTLNNYGQIDCKTPEIIKILPYSKNNISTCGTGSQFNQSHVCCSEYLNGEEYVFKYEPVKNECINISIIINTNFKYDAAVFFTRGCPNQNAVCCGYYTQDTTISKNELFLYDLPVVTGQTYYIIVSSKTTCFNFSISIKSQECIMDLCTNADFEFGNIIGWDLFLGRVKNCESPEKSWVRGSRELPLNGNICSESIRATLTTGNSTDPNTLDQIEIVAPNGGNYSLRLGQSKQNSYAERISKTFIVKADKPIFTYQYAIVLEDPGHNEVCQPEFIVRLLDENGNTVPGPCGSYRVYAQKDAPGFYNSFSNVCKSGRVETRFKKWTTVTLDLSNYIGKKMTIDYTIKDCGLDGHFGYAYLDANCSNITADINGEFSCKGTGTLTLDAGPYWDTYLWSTGQTTSTIVISSPHPGDTVRVALQSFAGCGTTREFIIPTPQNFTTTTLSKNVTCPNDNNGSATVHATGGITPYHYTWSSGDVDSIAKNLSIGMYYVTVTAANWCKHIDSVLIGDSSETPVLLNTTATTSGCGFSCFGTANVIATGGSTPYSYKWSNGSITQTATNLCADFYRVTVTTKAGCRYSDTITIVPSVSYTISIDTVLQHETCQGACDASITITPKGGTSPYTYLWSSSNSTNINNQLCSGIYSVTITDVNGCSNSSSIILLKPSNICIIQASNIFTPNGDNINDIFYFKTDGIVKFHAEIYNRWGGKIYEWDIPSGGWDGGNSPSGTYYFIVEAQGADGAIYKQQGIVTLMR